MIGLGQLARQGLGPQERYSVRFADTDCPAPPGRERRDFLDEVQYLSSLPERVNVLDPALPDRLTEAFGRHPQVEHVDRVEVGAGGIRVELRFRR